MVYSMCWHLSLSKFLYEPIFKIQILQNPFLIGLKIIKQKYHSNVIIIASAVPARRFPSVQMNNWLTESVSRLRYFIILNIYRFYLFFCLDDVLKNIDFTYKITWVYFSAYPCHRLTLFGCRNSLWKQCLFNYKSP